MRPAADTAPHDHTEGITSFTLVRDEPVRGVALALYLSALAGNCGADLLRLKGIVNVMEDSTRPAVIHGVQHVYHAPEWLERWPSEDHRTRIVFIGRNLNERWARMLLELLEAEVAEASGF
jgi:G3E family GTPase